MKKAMARGGAGAGAEPSFILLRASAVYFLPRSKQTPYPEGPAPPPHYPKYHFTHNTKC